MGVAGRRANHTLASGEFQGWVGRRDPGLGLDMAFRALFFLNPRGFQGPRLRDLGFRGFRASVLRRVHVPYYGLYI